jgi:uncharacterized protein (DUF488 family)
MERTIMEVHGSLHVAIPREIARVKGWKAGDRVSFREADGSLVLRVVVSPGGRAVYTVGYEGRTPDGLLDVLRHNHVSKVIDVRERPMSRKRGFSKAALSIELGRAGIEYYPLPELGSPSAIRHVYKEAGDFGAFEKGYRAHLEPRTKELRALRALVAEEPTAILCYEKDWTTCHRSILSEYLGKEGFRAVHL